MRPTITATADQDLGPPGTAFQKGYPIVVRHPDQLGEWDEIFDLEAWKPGVVRLHLRGYLPNWGEVMVICYCSIDILRVAKETDVI